MVEKNQGRHPFLIPTFQVQAWPVFWSRQVWMMFRREPCCSHFWILAAYLYPLSRSAVCHEL